MVERVRAFIIDDDPRVRGFLKLLMTRRQYEVVEYPRALPCQVCRNEPGVTCADLIICDVSMPGLKGTDFVSHQVFVGCKCENIALMSGQWRAEDLRLARRLGCRIFPKPFALGEVEGWLDQCEQRIHPDRLLADRIPGS